MTASLDDLVLYYPDGDRRRRPVEGRVVRVVGSTLFVSPPSGQIAPEVNQVLPHYVIGVSR